MRDNIINKIKQEKIIAIIRGVNVEQAVKVAKALYNGGVKMIEVTFCQNAPQTFAETAKAISEIKKISDDISVGAGTVLTVEQVDIAKSAGAEYIISPDTDEAVIKHSLELGLVSIPGAFTATEAKKAHDYGADFVKIFPCESASYVKALSAPLSHINFLAVGGINLENAKNFINAGACGVGIGSSLVDKKLISEGKYDKVRELAKSFVEKIR